MVVLDLGLSPFSTLDLQAMLDDGLPPEAAFAEYSKMLAEASKRAKRISEMVVGGEIDCIGFEPSDNGDVISLLPIGDRRSTLEYEQSVAILDEEGFVAFSD